MNKFMETMEKYLLPIASKISNQRFLIALRDSFIGTMPVVMAGSVAILLNAFLVDVPAQFGNTSIPETFKWIVDINNLISKGSISIVSLLFIFSLGVNIAKIYKTDTLSSGIVSLAAFIIAIGNSISQKIQLPNADGQTLSELFNGISGVAVDGNSLAVTIGNVIPVNQINSRGYFTAMIIGFLASIIFCKLMKKDWTIKLPDTVPPAIAKPFMSIIPGLVSLYVVAIVAYAFNRITGQLINDWIFKVLQTPLLGLSQSYLAVVILAVAIQLLWFFGIHGGNVMAPIMEGVFGVALLANMEAFQNNEPLPYLWTSVSFGSFVWFATVGLLIAIFLKSRNKHYREVAKLGIVPCMFNIGEPVMYGLPTVMNPILFIPKILAPALMVTVAYFATSIGFLEPVSQNVTWVMPPILYGFFSTGFDWRAIVVSLINLVIATLVYLPFVMIADKENAIDA